MKMQLLLYATLELKNLEKVTSQADILVAAVGRAKMIKENSVKEGAVVIDVGINVDENGNLCGDVDTASVQDKVSMITPVPAGVVLLQHLYLLSM